MVDDIGHEEYVSSSRKRRQYQLHDVWLRHGLSAQCTLGIPVRRGLEDDRPVRAQSLYQELCILVDGQRRPADAGVSQVRRSATETAFCSAGGPDLSGQLRPRALRRFAEHLQHRRSAHRILLLLFAGRQDLQLLRACDGRRLRHQPVPLHARRVASRAQPGFRPAPCGNRRPTGSQLRCRCTMPRTCV